jgi:hypothetical protein
MDQQGWGRWVAAKAGGGILGYSVPHLLVGAGLPIDRWAVTMGSWVSLSFSREFAVNAMGAVLGVVMLGWGQEWPKRFRQTAAKCIDAAARALSRLEIRSPFTLRNAPVEIKARSPIDDASPPPEKPPAPQSPAVAESPRQLTAYEIERKLRILDEMVVPQLDRMRLLINEGERLQSSGWNAFKDPNSYPEYCEKLKDFRDRFRNHSRELHTIAEDQRAHSDIGDAIGYTSHETWAQAIEKYMVKYGYFHRWMHADAPREAYTAFLEDDANNFGKAIIEYSIWCSGARVRVIGLQRKLAA